MEPLGHVDGIVSVVHVLGKRRDPDPELKEELTCPICLLFFGGGVFQCSEGHVICGDCMISLARPIKCPTCRGSLSNRIRNRALERLAEPFLVDCGFMLCDFRGLEGEMEGHRKKCFAQPVHCPVKGCEFIGDWTQVMMHMTFLGVHKAAVVINDASGRVEFELELDDRYTVLLIQDAKYMLGTEVHDSMLMLRLLYFGMDPPCKHRLTAETSPGNKRAAESMTVNARDGTFHDLANCGDCVIVAMPAVGQSVKVSVELL